MHVSITGAVFIVCERAVWLWGYVCEWRACAYVSLIESWCDCDMYAPMFAVEPVNHHALNYLYPINLDT